MPVIYINNEFREVPDREAMRLVLSGGRLVHQDPDLSYGYASGMIGGPWPPGEAAIRSEPNWWERYQEFLKSCQ